jgi:hypothetical protein
MPGHFPRRVVTSPRRCPLERVGRSLSNFDLSSSEGIIAFTTPRPYKSHRWIKAKASGPAGRVVLRMREPPMGERGLTQDEGRDPAVRPRSHSVEDDGHQPGAEAVPDEVPPEPTTGRRSGVIGPA